MLAPEDLNLGVMVEFDHKGAIHTLLLGHKLLFIPVEDENKVMVVTQQFIVLSVMVVEHVNTLVVMHTGSCMK